jgi:hypothetical protein
MTTREEHPASNILTRFNFIASSRRTLYTMGGLAVLFVLGISIGLSASMSSNPDENPFLANSEPEFNKFVAAEADDLSSSSKVVKKRQSPTGSGVEQPFSLEEIVDNRYSAERWNGTWVSDTEYAYRNREGALALLNVVSGQSRTLVPDQVMNNPSRVFRFWLSPDLTYVLLAMRPQKLFRHSFIAIYDIYNVATGQRTKLAPPESVLRKLGGPRGPPGGEVGQQGPPPGGPQEGGPPGGRFPGGPPQLPLMYAEWAPSGNAIAYVFSNNIYYRSSPTADDVTISESGTCLIAFIPICVNC